MSRVTSIEELSNLKSKIETERKFTKQVLICGGTGCISSGSNEIAYSGRLFFLNTSLKIVAIALFEFSASFPPFKTQTFPLLKQSAAVSLVTFGRLS